jgi:hypothetical protein
MLFWHRGTWRDVRSESRFEGKTEVGFRVRQDRFWHKAGPPSTRTDVRSRGKAEVIPGDDDLRF